MDKWLKYFTQTFKISGSLTQKARLRIVGLVPKADSDWDAKSRRNYLTVTLEKTMPFWAKIMQFEFDMSSVWSFWIKPSEISAGEERHS